MFYSKLRAALSIATKKSVGPAPQHIVWCLGYPAQRSHRVPTPVPQIFRRGVAGGPPFCHTMRPVLLLIAAACVSGEYLIEKKKHFGNDDCPSHAGYKRITNDLFPNTGKILCEKYAQEINREFQQVDSYMRPYGCTKKRQTPQKVYWNTHDGGGKGSHGYGQDKMKGFRCSSWPDQDINCNVDADCPETQTCTGGRWAAMFSASSGQRTKLHCNHNYAGNHDCVCTNETPS